MNIPDGKVLVSILGDDYCRLRGLHLCRFDGADATQPLPRWFGADLYAVWGGLSDPDIVARILAWGRGRLAEVSFTDGSTLARRLAAWERETTSAGEPVYFGMGWWGRCVGLIDAGAAEGRPVPAGCR